MKKSHRVAVIMAGGSGERFWPLSRQERPKQLLKLASSEATLLEEAIDRITPLIAPEDVYISTTTALAGPIRKAGLGLPPANVLAEPCKRNTAGCLTWVAAELLAKYGDENVTMAVLTSDHQIGRPTRFRACVDAALKAAEREAALVTIGIKPTRAETGYGYVEVKETAGKGARRVARFREKPNHELALEFLESGRHYWNSGMFFWTIGTLLSELEQASPEHAEALRSIAEALRAGKKPAAEKAFEKLPDISIDYALMERSRNVCMVVSDFPWDDVGAWDALDRSRPHDEHGNVTEGAPVLVDTRESIVVNDVGEDKVAVGVVGLEKVVVIVSRDAVLVAAKDRAQDVRQIVKELKAKGKKQV